MSHLRSLFITMNYNFCNGDRFSIIESCFQILMKRLIGYICIWNTTIFPRDILKGILRETQILTTIISNSFRDKLLLTNNYYITCDKKKQIVW